MIVGQIVANGVNEAFTELFSILKSNGIESAPRGHRIKEIINANIIIKNPRDRIVMCPERRMDMAYAFGELAWYLSGRNDKDTMCYYSKFMENMSDDGKTLNSAYGYRIFGGHQKIGFDQFQNAINLLKKDKDTRQAVIHLHTPNNQPTKDEVCTMSLQFLLRNGKLDMITTMRSNDLVLGFTYDVFSFTMLQEIMANELDVEVGTYYHNVGSMHYYEDGYYSNNDVVERRTYVSSIPMSPFNFNLKKIRDCLVSYEKYVRLKTLKLQNASNGEKANFINGLLRTIAGQKNKLEILFESAFALKAMKKLKMLDKQSELLNMVSERKESLTDMLLLNAKYERNSEKIIFEGVDGAGKTTLIKRMKNDGRFIRHYDAPSCCFEYFREYMLNLKSDISMVFDRFYISEIVYSQELERKCGLSNEEIVSLEQRLVDSCAEVNFIIAMDKKQLKKVKSRLKQSDDWLREHIESLNDRYKVYANHLIEIGANVKILPVE